VTREGTPCIAGLLLISAMAIAALGACDNARGPSATATMTASPPLFDLPSTVRKMIAVAASPSGFASLGKTGLRLRRFFLAPRFPKSYSIYRVLGAGVYVVANGPQKNIMSLIWVDDSIQGLETPIEPAAVQAARMEEMVSPLLGDHYSRRTLQTGMLFTSPGRPTVEFIFLPGLPSESTFVSYAMAIAIFPPRTPILEVISPCDRWWLSTPPAGWVRRVGEGCEPYWARVALKD
jgi:hypothetical protein